MLADSEAQALLARGLRPDADNVVLRPHVHGIPARVLRVPKVEVIVMHAHADEVLRAGLLVEAHQVVRVPLRGLPVIHQILVADLGGMAVGLHMVEILLRTLHVHLARIPVAELRSPTAAPSATRCRTWRRGTTRESDNPGEKTGLPGSCRPAPAILQTSREQERNTRRPSIEATHACSLPLRFLSFQGAICNGGHPVRILVPRLNDFVRSQVPKCEGPGAPSASGSITKSRGSSNSSCRARPISLPQPTWPGGGVLPPRRSSSRSRARRRRRYRGLSYRS